MKNSEVMRESSPSPPRLALRLFRFFAGPEHFAFAAGDLTERFDVLAREEGTSKASRWFFFEVLKAIPGFLKNAFYWRIAMFRNYFIIAWRHMSRSKILSSINILGLSVGMACFILISLWIQDEKSYDRFHTNRQRLFQLIIVHPDGTHDPNTPYALAPILAAEYPEITSLSRVYEVSNIATCSFLHRKSDKTATKFYEDRVIQVDPAFFTMFSFPFLSGEPETCLENPTSIVISENAAIKYFGSEDPLGKILTFNGAANLTVGGVVRVPDNSHLQFDFAGRLGPNFQNNWNWADPSYVLIGEGVATDRLREKIAESLNTHYPQPLPDRFTVDLLPLTESYLHFGRAFYVKIFSLIASFILFIACVNYMNLATASSANRTREVGLRKVVGARKPQLVQQFLGESFLTAVLSLALSVVLVRAFLGPLNTLTAKELSFHPLQSGGMAALLLGLVVVVGIFSGSYPAFFLSSARPSETIKLAVHKRRGRHAAFRPVTVTGQFVISVLLIACTAVVFKQLNYMRGRPLGLRTDHVIELPMNRILLGRFGVFRADLKTHPGIVTVTAGQSVPFDEDYKTSGVEWTGKDPDMMANLRYSIGRTEYIETFEIEVIDGRPFSEERRDDLSNFMINQKAAEYFGMETPIGQPLSMWGRQGQIIGVVKDFHQVSLHREIMPQVMTIHPDFSGALKHVFVKIRADNIPETLAFIQESFAKFSPQFPFEYSFLDKRMDDLYTAEKRLGRIFGYFAFLAIFISCLGIFGLSAFSAEKRAKEISVRRVLGATPLNISLLLSKSFGRWLLLANAIAWPVGWYVMSRWLERFAYRTDLPLVIFVASGMMAFLIAAVPVGYQSLKAAAADPVDSLRYE